ncbi:pepsin/retropepsin-like aspartic protease family protein [Mucilaginibacter sp. SG564]|uniref:pepsin/retropepsin-like aspartic protease family protein n=1 Tax=unclassified Mucilaginibacter TaxID=2617802 RepID=UPI00155570C1|nr:pepsin/retropepsin-like aspartic protease family protein [Mucilaginibacter sp. SG564]NOW97609.1 putative aspartyl protease [Mucilaginibacter sp. SG564]
MKIRCLLTLTIMLFAIELPLSAQIKQLNELVYTKQYTQLEQVLSTSHLSANNRMLYQAFLANVFNQPETSSVLLKKIFAGKIGAGDSKLQFYLHRIAYDNYVKLSQYKGAHTAAEQLVKDYRAMFSPSELTDQLDENKIWAALANTPVQQVQKQASSAIPVKKDMAGLWNIPVQQQDSSYLFIFDTGANISTITATYAQKLNLDVIKSSEVRIDGGMNGVSSKVKLGMAKHLHIGKVQINNALFLIFPDSALSFAGGAYKINGIIGLPIIKALEEITIARDTMHIPLVADKRPVPHNLALDLLQPIIYMDYQSKALPFTFDTGAQGTLFSDNFYKRFKTQLDSISKKDSLQMGGAGGSRRMNIIKVPQLTFTVDHKPVLFRNTQVSLETAQVSDKYYYGNIGQDMFIQFTSMTINFVNSSVSFGDRKEPAK